MAKLWACVLLLAACDNGEAPGRTFYQEHVQPVFNSFCVGDTSPCHRDDGTGAALGNLDLTSFANVTKRRDALVTYGSYPLPLLLLKSVPEQDFQIPYRGRLLPVEIRHAGAKGIAVDSDAFFVLRRWLDNGATESGLPPPALPQHGEGPCNPTIPPGVDLSRVDTLSPAYLQFVATVEPLLVRSCAAASCHGTGLADFHLTCGSDESQHKFNFFTTAGFVAQTPAPPEQSELLVRPLAPAAGGVSHAGGILYQTQDDPDWKALRAWAVQVQQSPTIFPPPSAGQQFFDDHVMPILLQRGCALMGCHSPVGFNGFRLAGGAQGFFSPFALARNHDELIKKFMSLDTPEPRQSRAVRKTIIGGITHRGGQVLETPGHDSNDPCPSPYDPATSTAFCTIAEWQRIERQTASVSPLASGDTVPVAWIARPPDPDALIEFDTFRGGADLELGDAIIGAGGRIESIGNVRSALAACAPLSGRSDLDVRGPEWSFDGTRLAFAVRQGAAGGLDLWMLDLQSGACTQLTHDGGRMMGPVRVHNFDPLFAPDGSLVFASTRAGTLTLKYFLPNSDLWRVGPNLDFTTPERMTVLLGSELAPSFMQDGHVIFTAEKASPDFYQLSGRRLNWDLTDYHPLLAQRDKSDDTFGHMYDSIGYRQGTEIREALDRNFLVILSNPGARGAGGCLATFNRSIGPFEQGRTDITYLHSLHVVDAAATGRAGTVGVYRSPYPLPNGEILASYAGNVSNPEADTPQYDLVAVDDRSGDRRVLVAGGARSLVEAAVGYKRSTRLLAKLNQSIGFSGDSTLPPDQAVLTLLDVPMLATLLNSNLRRGRNVAGLDVIAGIRAWVDQPPPTPTPDPSKLSGPEAVYSDRIAAGVVTLESDHSLKVAVPPGVPLIFELLDSGGQHLFTMREELQYGPGENIKLGLRRQFFNGQCGGCHGSISGRELDVVPDPDALTNASQAMAVDKPPQKPQ